MINVSEQYKASAAKPDAQWHGRATVTLRDGTVLHLTNSNIMDSGISILDGTSNSGSFDVGFAGAQILDLKINNFEGAFNEYDFVGATVVPYIGIDLPKPDDLDGGILPDGVSDITEGGNFIDYNSGDSYDGGSFAGSQEWLRKGIFTVDIPETAGTVITLTALDNMVKFDKPYTESTLNYPAPLYRILADACARCGVPLATARFYNDDYVVSNRPDDKAITFRDMVSYIAQLSGNFARINNAGALELRWYEIDLAVKGAETDLDGGSFIDMDSGDDADGGNFTHYKNLVNQDGGLLKYPDGEAAELKSLSSFSAATENVTVTGVSVVPMDEEATTYISGVPGYVVTIRDNPLAQDNLEYLTSMLGQKLVDFEFRPLSVSGIGDPRYEAGDVAAVHHRGAKYPAIISNLNYTIRAYESFASDAESEVDRAQTRYSPAAKAEQAAKVDADKKFVAYDEAQRNLNALMANAMGFYQTSDRQPDGSTVEYMHDKPELFESQIIWKRTLDGFAISTDGGQTWDAGFTADGNAVVKILTALGINADWINAGTIDASKIDVINLNASEITSGEINTDLIRSGRIQSKDGSVYIDLENNKSAVTLMVDPDSDYSLLVGEYSSGQKGLVLLKNGLPYGYLVNSGIDSLRLCTRGNLLELKSEKRIIIGYNGFTPYQSYNGGYVICDKSDGLEVGSGYGVDSAGSLKISGGMTGTVNLRSQQGLLELYGATTKIGSSSGGVSITSSGRVEITGSQININNNVVLSGDISMGSHDISNAYRISSRYISSQNVTVTQGLTVEPSTFTLGGKTVRWKTMTVNGQTIQYLGTGT